MVSFVNSHAHATRIGWHLWAIDLRFATGLPPGWGDSIQSNPGPTVWYGQLSGLVGSHPGVELRANLKSISHRCYLFEVAFVWELTKETIDLPLGCLQGGSPRSIPYLELERAPFHVEGLRHEGSAHCRERVLDELPSHEPQHLRARARVGVRE